VEYLIKDIVTPVNFTETDEGDIRIDEESTRETFEEELKKVIEEAEKH
jgi:ferredoxin